MIHDEVFLTEAISKAWENSETDGIIQLGLSLWNENQQRNDENDWNLQEIVSSSMEALTSKGQLAGVLNAWIGSCCVMQHKNAKDNHDDNDNDDDASSSSFSRQQQQQQQQLAADRAYQLLDLYDNYVHELEPDIVTLSLVYTALMRPNLPEEYHLLGIRILQRAQKLSKKIGGSKRRKSLAASTRKQKQQQNHKNNNHNDRKELLQELYGIDILYESDQEIIVNKPSGMLCYHKHTTTSGTVSRKRKNNKHKTGNSHHDHNNNDDDKRDISLETALLHVNIPLSSLNPEARGIVHRIDRGTSGVIVLAKTDERHAELVADFFLRRIQKEYLALVELPTPTTPPESTTTTTTSSSTLLLPLHNASSGSAGTLTTRVFGRPAISIYTVEERYGTNHHHHNMARLRFETKTGRKHQIRIHCAQTLQSPIVGDIKYKDPTSFRNNSKQMKERFCLHAARLSIPNLPEIKAPEPTWWEDYTQSSTK